MTTKIEVGDVLRHESGNEYTVLFMGESHGIAKLTKRTLSSLAALGSEMSFHDGITNSTIWTHRRAMPSIRTTHFLVWNSHGSPADGSIEEVDDAVDGWDFIAENKNYVAVIRVNPDQTWDYVNAEDEVLTPESGR